MTTSYIDDLNLLDMHVMLQTSYNCNHRCWFCTEWSSNGKSWTKSECDLVVDKLTQLPPEKNKIFIQFHGGEPTLCDHWEYIQYELVDRLKDRELFIQTQTNLSLSKDRLANYLDEIHKRRQKHHVIDINGSYHLGKQHINEYVEKMKMLTPRVAFGGVQFVGEIMCREEKTINEYNILENSFPGQICYRHVVVNQPGKTSIKNRYKTFSETDNTGNRTNIEYRYTVQNFPELLSRYYPHGWLLRFNTNMYSADSIWARYYISDILRNMLGKHEMINSAKINKCMTTEQVIEVLREHARDMYYEQLQPAKPNPHGIFCTSSSSGLCISSELVMYNCLDYLHSDIDGIPLNEVDMFNQFTDNKYKRCVSYSCNSCNFHKLKRVL